MSNDKEYILCAAIWYSDFECTTGLPENIDHGIVVCGMRHHDCIHTFYRLTGKHTKSPKIHVQGFITSKNRFVERIEAMKIAKEAGQGINYGEMKEGEQLFSEDLY